MNRPIHVGIFLVVVSFEISETVPVKPVSYRTGLQKSRQVRGLNCELDEAVHWTSHDLEDKSIGLIALIPLANHVNNRS